MMQNQTQRLEQETEEQIPSGRFFVYTLSNRVEMVEAADDCETAFQNDAHSLDVNFVNMIVTPMDVEEPISQSSKRRKQEKGYTTTKSANVKEVHKLVKSGVINKTEMELFFPIPVEWMTIIAPVNAVGVQFDYFVTSVLISSRIIQNLFPMMEVNFITEDGVNAVSTTLSSEIVSRTFIGILKSKLLGFQMPNNMVYNSFHPLFVPRMSFSLKYESQSNGKRTIYSEVAILSKEDIELIRKNMYPDWQHWLTNAVPKVKQPQPLENIDDHTDFLFDFFNLYFKKMIDQIYEKNKKYDENVQPDEIVKRLVGLIICVSNVDK